MKFKYIVIRFSLFFLPFYLMIAQEKGNENERFLFEPIVVGGQIEFSTLISVSELGALIDIDLFNKQSEINYSFGTRISFESYWYFAAGGSIEDYCVFIMHSARSRKFHFNLLGGIAYHTRSPNYYPDEFLFRTGIELRYNVLDKIVGIVLKGSTSFVKNSAYVGLGIAIGYYK